MTEKTLDEKIKEAGKKLGGIEDMLKPSSGGIWDINWTNALEDVQYAETDKYKIIGAKWETHKWSDNGEGIGWEGWTSLHYQEKGERKDIKKLKTEAIQTRHPKYPKQDRPYLRAYNSLKITPLEDSKIEIAWARKTSGEKSGYDFLKSIFDLDSGKIIEKESPKKILARHDENKKMLQNCFC